MYLIELKRYHTREHMFGIALLMLFFNAVPQDLRLTLLELVQA